MIAENRHTQVMCRIVVVAILLLCALAVMAEDVTFMSNRRHWEKLPTATLMKMGCDYGNSWNQPDSALLCLTLVANRYDKHLNDEDLKCTIRALCWIARIYNQYYHDQEKSYRYLLNAKDRAETHHYDEFLPYIYSALADISWQQQILGIDTQEINDALSWYKKSFNKQVECKNYELAPATFIDLAYGAISADDIGCISHEIQVYDQLPIPDTVPLLSCARSVRQGLKLLANDKAEQALKVFKETVVDGGTPRQRVSVQLSVNAMIYYSLLRLGRNDEALKTVIDQKELILENAPSLLGWYVELTKCYRRLGNRQLAEKYELLTYRTADSLKNVIHANEVATVGFLHEIDKMNEEQKALTLKQQHDRQMLWVVSGFLALALVLLTLLMINRNRIKEKNRVLYENNVELLAADEQRRKLAELQQRTEAEKYGAIRMDEQSTEELWQNIIHVMEYSPEIYDENFSEPRLAELIEAKQNYVSQAINQQKDWSFSSLVTHYRIREACRRMNDTANYGNYTVEGIGQSVGYSSRSHFVKLFKRQTGLTPSDYMKQCRAGTPPEVLLRPHPLSTSVQSP